MKVIKKIFQFLVIIICIGVVIVLIYLGYILISNKLEERLLDNERTNSSNLMEYFKYHDFEHVHSSKKELYYIGENFVCDALNDHQVIAVDRDFMILDDYSIYQIILDQEKTFSNHQSCKKVETDIEISKVKQEYSTYYLFDQNNQQYAYNRETDQLEQCGYDSNYCMNANPILAREDIVSIVNYLDSYTYLVLKTDGQIWKQSYKTSYNGTTTYHLVNEELVIPKETYGTIYEASTIDSIDLSLDSETITTLITDRGYFFLKQIETEECTKYEDVPCEYQFVESDVYKKYHDDIIYLGANYSVLSDHTIIETKELKKPLDPDVK